MNKVIATNRYNKYAGNNIKQQNENIVRWSIREAKLDKIENYPVDLKITWYEPNKRRDSDNIHSAVKFILDALVAENILENDSQKYVRDIKHHTRVDRDNPRIIVEIKEQQNE